MTHFEITIAQMKNKLIKKAQKHGIYENFGQKEYRKIKDNWERNPNYQPDVMEDFWNWITTYNGE